MWVNVIIFGGGGGNMLFFFWGGGERDCNVSSESGEKCFMSLFMMSLVRTSVLVCQLSVCQPVSVFTSFMWVTFCFKLYWFFPLLNYCFTKCVCRMSNPVNETWLCKYDNSIIKTNILCKLYSHVLCSFNSFRILLICNFHFSR